jgi:hypothetical protein
MHDGAEPAEVQDQFAVAVSSVCVPSLNISPTLELGAFD